MEAGLLHQASAQRRLLKIVWNHVTPDLLQVGAMSELKKDMSHWQCVLQGRIVEEVEEALYALKVWCTACMQMLCQSRDPGL